MKVSRWLWCETSSTANSRVAIWSTSAAAKERENRNSSWRVIAACGKLATIANPSASDRITWVASAVTFLYN